MQNVDRIINDWLIKEQLEVGDRIKVTDEENYNYGIYDIDDEFEGDEQYVSLFDKFDNCFDKYYIMWCLINGDLDYEVIKDSEE